MIRNISITSVSWIERTLLPSSGHKTVLGGFPIIGSWVNRVVLGLVATSNPRPPKNIQAESFEKSGNFRSLTHFNWFPELHQKNRPIVGFQSAGTTPPFDSSKASSFLLKFAPIPIEAKTAHPGENSSLSKIIRGRLHPNSTLIIDTQDEIIVSTLIKFRAGAVTDKLGIEEAKSPFHVPWVWCEHTLVRNGGNFKLFVNGSTFPSHAWYVNGSLVGISEQPPVRMTESEPALSAGRSASESRMDYTRDVSQGPVSSHESTLAGKGQVVFEIVNQ